MCGRFTLGSNLDRLFQELAARLAIEVPRNYNVAPTDNMPVCRIDRTGRREIVLMRWGLVPSWLKDAKAGYKMINARAESVADKPSLRGAFEKRRCLVLADGYYEWKTVGKEKQPFYIHMQDRRPFTFAGLWERHGALETFTIITTDANELTAEVHDRMPVIIDDVDRERWLDHSVRDRGHLLQLLKPFDAGAMHLHAVDRRVGNVRNNDPKCVESERVRL